VKLRQARDTVETALREQKELFLVVFQVCHTQACLLFRLAADINAYEQTAVQSGYLAPSGEHEWRPIRLLVPQHVRSFERDWKKIQQRNSALLPHT